MEVVTVEHCECTMCHQTVPFKMFNFILYKFCLNFFKLQRFYPCPWNITWCDGSLYKQKTCKNQYPLYIQRQTLLTTARYRITSRLVLEVSGSWMSQNSPKLPWDNSPRLPVLFPCTSFPNPEPPTVSTTKMCSDLSNYIILASQSKPPISKHKSKWKSAFLGHLHKHPLQVPYCPGFLHCLTRTRLDVLLFLKPNLLN